MRTLIALLVLTSTAFAGGWIVPLQGERECTADYNNRMDESLRQHTAQRELEVKIEKLELEQQSAALERAFSTDPD